MSGYCGVCGKNSMGRVLGWICKACEERLLTNPISSKLLAKADYHKAIATLNAGLKQLEPDGNNCSICGDSGHQAWGCHHNPLTLQYAANTFWRCWHCGATFTDLAEAEEHFGKSRDEMVSCQREEEPSGQL